MAQQKKDEAPNDLRVLVPFAYATVKGTNEVKQLVKHDLVDDRYTKESVDHLRSIGFVGHN
jgi:hypothetical protein